MSESVRKPVFFIGMPRSGTTIAFEAFARHPELAWPTNYTAIFPRLPQLNAIRRLIDNRGIQLIGRKNQYGRPRFGNRALPMPNEAYEFWNLYADSRFARDFLRLRPNVQTRDRLTHAVGALVSWQGKRRFAAKLTGPPRIEFLSTVFPDAIFVHVVRDGRAVVHSLLNVAFWRQKGGLETPFWSGGHTSDEFENPRKDPGILAALQWREVISTARMEGSKLHAGQFVEVRYEDFVTDPTATLNSIARACGLTADDRIESYLRGGVKLSNMNQKYLRDFSAEYANELALCMQPFLGMYGYKEMPSMLV